MAQMESGTPALALKIISQQIPLRVLNPDDVGLLGPLANRKTQLAFAEQLTG